MTNSTLIKPFLFAKKLRKLRSIPKDSEERIKMIEDFLMGVKQCLINNADEPVEKLLSSRYICPFLYRIHEEKNVVKISDTIVMALIQPGLVQNFRFAVSIADSTKKSLINICDTTLSPHIKTTFGKAKNGDLCIYFLSN
jgi:hypothetical protein